MSRTTVMGEELKGDYLSLKANDLPPDPSASNATTSEEDKIRYIDFSSEKRRPKDEQQKQVGWWLGRVEQVYEDYFTATLEDLQGRISTAEFDKEEVSPSELNLLVPNVRFSYTVTQVDKRSGREYVTKISFSGPIIWTEKDQEKAKIEYSKLFPENLFSF